MIRRAIALIGFAIVVRPTPVVADPVIIQGVPRIGWATGRYSHHVAALQAALSAMGRDVSYDYLMLASGAGFRAAWRIDKYDYAAMCVHLPDDDYVIAAAEAAGVEAERTGFREPDEARRAVRESIDRGCPVVAWEESGAQVICGYDPATARMYVRSCNSTAAEYDVRPFDIPPSPPPFGQPNEVVLLTAPYSVTLPDPDWHAILSRAIRFADSPPEDRLYGGNYSPCGYGG